MFQMFLWPYSSVPSVPTVRGPGGNLVVAPAQKALLFCCQSDITLLGAAFNSFTCFVQSRYNYLFGFLTPVLLSLLLELDTYESVWFLARDSFISEDGCGYGCSKTKHNFSTQSVAVVSLIFEIYWCRSKFICNSYREFSNFRQRVVIYQATTKWVLIVSGVSQLGHAVFVSLPINRQTSCCWLP